MIDVCYMLGTESEADDWELRLSLRSWRKHFALNRFIIVGHCPAWLGNDDLRRAVVHAPFPDPYRHNKDANLIQKAVWLAGQPWVTDPFILCSDDQFLLRPINKRQACEHWHHGDKRDARFPANHTWWKRLGHTVKALDRRKKGTLHFDTHIPIALTKAQALGALQWDYGAEPGMCIFTLMLNAAGVRGRAIDSERIRGFLGKDTSAETVAAKLAANRFANIDSDSLRNPAVVRALEAAFPEPGPWERMPARSPLDFPNLYPPPPEPVLTEPEYFL